MNHFGLLSTIQSEQNLHKDVDDRQSIIDRLTNDTSWQGVKCSYVIQNTFSDKNKTPSQARIQNEIQRLKVLILTSFCIFMAK